MKVEGAVLSGGEELASQMERMVYAAAYGAEYAVAFDEQMHKPGSTPQAYMVLVAASRAASRGRQAVEAFRKMLEDVS